MKTHPPRQLPQEYSQTTMSQPHEWHHPESYLVSQVTALIEHWRTTNVQMAPLFFPGLKGNHWLGTSQSQTTTQSHTSVTQTVSTPRDGRSSSGTTQDHQVLQAGKHTHVLPHCHRDSRHMGWHGHWASPGDWQTHHCHHPGYQGNMRRLHSFAEWLRTGTRLYKLQFYRLTRCAYLSALDVVVYHLTISILIQFIQSDKASP